MKNSIILFVTGGLLLFFSNIAQAQTPCASVVTLVSPDNDINDGAEFWGATEALLASNQINGADVEFLSEQTIRLNDGFKVFNSTLLAHIDQPCLTLIHEVSQIQGQEVRKFPNPFTTSVTFEFTLKTTETLQFEFYDANGRLLDLPVKQQTYSPGTHQFSFDGSKLPSGIYLYKIIAGDEIASGRITRIQ
ncbi:MAG: T9SS C-terminal target domain-containing protein [Bacteroidetes bacterium]|nr:MAG: T9SS C-terminal target domain-containing protein [Bacteroidota bacterium]